MRARCFIEDRDSGFLIFTTEEHPEIPADLREVILLDGLTLDDLCPDPPPFSLESEEGTVIFRRVDGYAEHEFGGGKPGQPYSVGDWSCFRSWAEYEAWQAELDT